MLEINRLSPLSLYAITQAFWMEPFEYKPNKCVKNILENGGESVCKKTGGI